MEFSSSPTDQNCHHWSVTFSATGSEEPDVDSEGVPDVSGKSEGSVDGVYPQPASAKAAIMRIAMHNETSLKYFFMKNPPFLLILQIHSINWPLAIL